MRSLARPGHCSRVKPCRSGRPLYALQGRLDVRAGIDGYRIMTNPATIGETHVENTDYIVFISFDILTACSRRL
jgi:hypothetical protein